MTRTAKLSSLLIAVVLIVVPGLATPTLADPVDVEASRYGSHNQLVGSWLVYMDHMPDVGPLLYTFNDDGTLIGIAPANWVSSAHGVWEKVGCRTYDATQINYVFGEDGTAAFLQKARFRIVVSRDGQSCTMDVMMETMLLDGTIIKTGTETDTGTRLTVEPFD